MSSEALLNLVYQLGLFVIGLLIASLAMRFRATIGQWFGGFVCDTAAVWAAWTAVDQYFLVARPFPEKWLGLVQVLATVVVATLLFAVVIFSTGRPQQKEELSS